MTRSPSAGWREVYEWCHVELADDSGDEPGEAPENDEERIRVRVERYRENNQMNAANATMEAYSLYKSDSKVGTFVAVGMVALIVMPVLFEKLRE